MRHSLRIRLTVSCTLAIAVLLAALGITLYISLHRAFTSRFDLSLRTRAAMLVNAIDWDSRKGIHVGEESHLRQGPTGLAVPDYYQIWTTRGQSIVRARGLRGHSLAFEPRVPANGAFIPIRLADHHPAREYIFQIVRKPDDDHEHGQHGHQDHAGSEHPARKAAPALPMEPARIEHRRSVRGPQRYILAVARPTGDLMASIDSLRWSLMIACSAATLLSAAIMWQLLNRGFGSIGKIADEITRVGATDLSDRVSITHVPDELRPIVDRLNQLLQRVEDTVHREKAMTADIAHELRTPLAGMRAAAELALSRPRQADEYRSIFQQVLAMEMQMQQLVENLLTLARLEARGIHERDDEDCDPADIARRLIEERQNEFRNRQIQLALNFSSDRVIRAPGHLLRTALRNVIDNAIEYTNNGGTVEISTSADSQNVIFEISNTGSHIHPTDVPLVFERFWRGDEARSKSERHSGLGLSIVRQAMENMGGTIQVSSEMGGWFRVRLEFRTTKAAGGADTSGTR